MGFFSYKCKECNLTIMNSTSLTGALSVVAVDYKDNVLTGYYDGYGRVAGVDLLQDGRDGIHPFDSFIYTWKEQLDTVMRNRENQNYRRFKFMSDEALEEHFMNEYVCRVPDLYHECCYNEEKHSKHSGGSESCEYQGHFIGDRELIALILGNAKFMSNAEEFGVDFRMGVA